jgi:hypothetical protein
MSQKFVTFNNILQVIRQNRNILTEQGFLTSKPEWKYLKAHLICVVHSTIPKHYEEKKCYHLVQFLDLTALL